MAPVQKRLKLDANHLQDRRPHFRSPIDVGICAFVRSTHRTFDAQLKHRAEDFHVHEIDANGDIVRLTSITAPPVVVAEEKGEEITPAARFAALQAFMSSTEAARLVALAEQADAKEVFCLPKPASKESRTAFHQLIKTHFACLDSVTKGDEIHVSRKGKSGGGGGKQAVFHKYPDEAKWLSFVLYKENRETMDCLQFLAAKLRAPSRAFTMAGTKDRRAMTTQRVVVSRMNSKRLYGINAIAENLRIGNCCPVDGPLQLGQHKGNHFDLVLRRVVGNNNALSEGQSVEDALEKALDASLEHVREHGFLNYFGMQRFGTGRYSSHEIGKCVLQGDFKTAVERILASRCEGHAQYHDPYMAWLANRDSRTFLNVLPRKFLAENKVLHALSKLNTSTPQNGDYLQAFIAIPKTMRNMYLHAFQSLIFNQMVSHRITTTGRNVLVGDMVLAEGGEIHPNDERHISVSFVTAETVDKVQLKDVVLPLPGSTVFYPRHSDDADLYRHVLKEHDLDLATFGTHLKQKELALTGSYRPMLCHVKDLTWRHLTYTDPHAPLIKSDLDLLQEASPPDESQDASVNRAETGKVEDPPFRALHLSFSLPTSAYATMLVREALGKDVDALAAKDGAPEMVNEDDVEEE